jgi:hypothetical protein
MTNLILPRRKFLTGLFGLVAAPAVVKASSLMPVKSVVEDFTTDGLLVSATERYTYGYQEFGQTFYSVSNKHLIESFQRTMDQMAATMADNLFGRTYQ